jgi:hypothetical protein
MKSTSERQKQMKNQKNEKFAAGAGLNATEVGLCLFRGL